VNKRAKNLRPSCGVDFEVTRKKKGDVAEEEGKKRVNDLRASSRMGSPKRAEGRTVTIRRRGGKGRSRMRGKEEWDVF